MSTNRTPPFKRDLRIEAEFPFMAELGAALEEFYRLDQRVTREQDVTCPLCGQRELRHTRDASVPAAVMAVCSKCSEG